MWIPDKSPALRRGFRYAPNLGNDGVLSIIPRATHLRRTPRLPRTPGTALQRRASVRRGAGGAGGNLYSIPRDPSTLLGMTNTECQDILQRVQRGPIWTSMTNWA